MPNGFIANLLGSIDSATLPLKRRFVNALRDPVGDVQQTLGLLDDRAKTFTNALDKSREGGELARMNSVMAGLPQYRQASDYVTNALTNQVMNFAPIGATVWHGSPHKFDKFDASKIGTGEGAQAYGHGLYFAENPGVAEVYQKTLSGKEPRVLQGVQPTNQVEQYAIGRVNDRLKYGNKSVEDAIKETILESRNLGGRNDPAYVNREKQIASYLEKLWDAKPQAPKNEGSLYKVDLPDEHIAKMLDWDKPLSQQPKEAQQPLRDMWLKAKKSFSGIDPNADPTASQIHHLYQQHRGGNSAVIADELRQAGIPGIRYLDGGSRGAGQGTSNYVVFPGNENLLQILERNGKLIK